jgi:hypothetical protein
MRRRILGTLLVGLALAAFTATTVALGVGADDRVGRTALAGEPFGLGCRPANGG